MLVIYSAQLGLDRQLDGVGAYKRLNRAMFCICTVRYSPSTMNMNLSYFYYNLVWQRGGGGGGMWFSRITCTTQYTTHTVRSWRCPCESNTRLSVRSPIWMLEKKVYSLHLIFWKLKSWIVKKNKALLLGGVFPLTPNDVFVAEIQAWLPLFMLDLIEFRRTQTHGCLDVLMDAW